MANNLTIDDKIKLAIDLCNKKKIKSNQFKYLYPFTTENINGYIDLFDLRDKTLLTVGSSGDQVLNAIFMDCKDITLYDICPFTKEYFYLKMALIMQTTRLGYLQFLCYKNYPIWPFKNCKSFDKITFDKIYEYLKYIDEESSYFWQQLFIYINNKDVRKGLFNPDEYNYRVVSKMNRYLISDDEYNSLRDKIDKVCLQFENGDIFDIDMNNKYDNIWLSNIAAYLNLDSFKEIFDKMSIMLKDDGKLLVSYLYDTDVDTPCIDEKNNIYSIKEVYNYLSNELVYTSFIGNNGLSVNDKRMTDSVLTYKKVKKI